MFCIHLCQNSLFWAFATGILWKTQLWDIFTRVLTAKCIASCSHGGSLEDDYCITFFKLKFLIPTLCQMFCLPKPSNIYGESDIVSPLCEISWKNIHFCGLKKETFISNGRKKLVNSSKKHIKFVSSGYYSPLCISALIGLFCLAFQGLSCWETSVTLYLWFQF